MFVVFKHLCSSWRIRISKASIKNKNFNLVVPSSCISTKNHVSCFIAIKLTNKCLLRVSGPESFIYLQTLLTNDMRKLLNPNEIVETNTKIDSNSKTNQTIIYSFLLSAVGRVLCDLFVYRGRFFANGDYVLEVDSNLATSIQRLLIGYNVAKSIQVEMAQDLNLWSIIPYTVFEKSGNLQIKPEERLRPIDSDDIKLAADPRVGDAFVGYRFLTRLPGSKLEDIGKFIKCQSDCERIELIEGNILDYIRLRYQLGIAEGFRDINSGIYYPFELNGDFLNAVSLDKGLYTSEEKTIKIYSGQHNHPIKRRLMPIEFQCDNRTLRSKSPAPGTTIHGPLSSSSSSPSLFNTSQKTRPKLGQLRQRLGRYGLASLLVPNKCNNLSKDANVPDRNLLAKLIHADSGLKLCASIPEWWPENFTETRLNPLDDNNNNNANNYPHCLFDLQRKAKQQS